MGSDLIDEIWGVEGARSRCVVLASDEGAIIELQQSLHPPVTKTPPQMLGYSTTGLHELGLLVDDIDGWFARIRSAGYETQTQYVWANAEGRSFLFYDQDHNLIQLWESSEQDWTREFALGRSE
jgi:hypothetical protein